MEKDGHFDKLAWLAVYAAIGSTMIGVVGANAAPRLALAIIALVPAFVLVSAGCILRQQLVVADRLPLGVATVGELAHAIKWQYYAETEQAERSAISDAGQATWNKLVGVLCEQLGVKPEEVTLARCEPISSC